MYNNGTPDYNTATEIAGGIATIVAIIYIIFIALSIVTLVATWKIYKKAGKPGWASIVPIYNYVVLIQITELPMWYLILLLFVPFANIYAMFKIYIELAHKFGKSTGFGVATVFFNIICLPILGFSKNCVYNPSNNNMQMNNNMQNINQQPMNTMVNPNNINNNINMQDVPMFNQNIDTNINQIQSEQNNVISNNIQMGNQGILPQENNMNNNITSNIMPNNGNVGSVNPINQIPQPVNEEQNIVPTPNINTIQPEVQINPNFNIEQNQQPIQNVVEPQVNIIQTPVPPVPETPNINTIQPEAQINPNFNIEQNQQPIQNVVEPQVNIIQTPVPPVPETPNIIQNPTGVVQEQTINVIPTMVQNTQPDQNNANMQ